MDNKYYVYILGNENRNVLYVGVTNNMARRLYEHKEGLHDGFTQKNITFIFCCTPKHIPISKLHCSVKNR